MSNHGCDCCAPTDDGPTDREVTDGGTTEREATDGGVTGEDAAGRDTGGPDDAVRGGHWLDAESATEAPLPPDVAAAMGELFGTGPVETLDAWADVIGETVDDGGGVEALCHADEPTPHRARRAGETYHFLCFFDAVVLSYLTGDPVDLRTESPGGDGIEAHVSPEEGVEADPPSAVVSFGVARDPASTVPEDGPTAAYGAVCPYVKAFPDRRAYEQWADGVDAATVGLPLADGVPFATAIVE